MKGKEVIKRLEAEQWAFARQKVTYRAFKKTGAAAVITAFGIDGEDVSPGQLQDIKRKAAWE